MDFKSHLEQAWSLTLKYIAPLIFMTLATVVISFITLGVLGPVTFAGYMQSVLMMVRSGREPKIQDIFSEMRLFLPLLAFGLFAAIAAVIGFSLFFLPGIVVICGIIFVCLYMLPLMTDRNFDVIDAIKQSYKMVTGPDLLEHVIVAILFTGISAVGSSVFVGWLFTQPLATIFLMLVYEEKFGQNPPSPPASEPPPAPPEPDEPPKEESPEEEITIKYKP